MLYMMNWYPFAVMSLFFMGLQRFLYKVSAERRCNTAWTTFSFMGTVAVLSSAVCLLRHEWVSGIPFLLFISIMNSSAFLAATIAHIEALKHLPASIVYPIIRLNVVVVVIFSVLYFRDRLSWHQVMGILLALAVIAILARETDEKESSRRNVRFGFLFICVSVVAGSVASVSSKFAAIRTDPLAFIAVSYVFATLCSFGLRHRLQRKDVRSNQRDAVKIGVVMGLINFAGYYSFLRALVGGPLSVVAPITGMHFVIGIVLSAVVYKERLTFMRVLAILLTIVSIILLR